MVDEYGLGYFEGVRAVALMYNRHLIRKPHYDSEGHHSGMIHLELDSEAFVTELAQEVQEALDMRDKK